MRSKGIAMSTRARPAAPRIAPVTPTSVAYRLPSEPRSVGWVRRELRRQLEQWGLAGELGEAAALLVSELVTNAVRAQAADGGAWVGVRFALEGGGRRVRLEVRDGSGGRPVINDKQAEETEEEAAECGRGLVLVDALASGWGVEPDGIGKVVWAELAVSAAWPGIGRR
ncbi:ATP-binding protein [Streptomyces sp. NPDC004296]|uniref:ATP-binding protein n=1 Tax=Streptomyces sp. NPDC004296 TaxID=3364697 RepID=UPI0036D0DE3B